MKIKEITAVQAFVPYAAPVGPYIGRGGSPGSLGATGLIVKVVSDDGLVGWGEGTGTLATDIEWVLVGRHVADIEAAVAAMEEADIPRGPMSGVEMALWDLLGKKAGLPICRLLGGVVREEVDFCACMGMKEPAQSAATAPIDGEPVRQFAIAAVARVPPRKTRDHILDIDDRCSRRCQ